jgi:pantothenate kinase-related protein Tda10
MTKTKVTTSVETVEQHDEYVWNYLQHMATEGYHILEISIDELYETHVNRFQVKEGKVINRTLKIEE